MVTVVKIFNFKYIQKQIQYKSTIIILNSSKASNLSTLIFMHNQYRLIPLHHNVISQLTLFF